MLCKLRSLSYMYIYIYIYIYIYLYRVIHRQTVSFYQNSSVWLETLDAWSRDRNLSNFTLDFVSDCSANKHTPLAKEIIRFQVAAAAAVCLHFYTLSATRVLKELCIMRVVAENSFTRVLNPGGQAFILSSSDWLFHSIRTLQCV